MHRLVAIAALLAISACGAWRRSHERRLEEECEREGGEIYWSSARMPGPSSKTCLRRAHDAGKACKSHSDCEVSCECPDALFEASLRSGVVDPGVAENVTGVCAADPPHLNGGAICTVENGHAELGGGDVD